MGNKKLFRDIVKELVDQLGEFGFRLFDPYSEWNEDDIDSTLDEIINDCGVKKEDIIVKANMGYRSFDKPLMLNDFESYSLAVKEVFDLSGMIALDFRQDLEKQYLDELELIDNSNWDENIGKLETMRDEGEAIWRDLNDKFKFDRNAGGYRNGWTFGNFIGNPEMNTLCDIPEYYTLQQFSDLKHALAFESKKFIIETAFPMIEQLEKDLNEVKSFEFTKDTFKKFNEQFPLKEVVEEME